jgi:dTDP-4-amino-4,6-dideoxygalactose transaminase
MDLEASPYERGFAQMLGQGVTAAAFWKGRVALYAILRAIGVGPGDEVVVPGFTCVVDIERDGFNVDRAQVAQALTPRTRALLVQHSFGIPADVEDLVDLAAECGVVVIEDCAHTMGTDHAGRPLGTAGDAAFFSFQWSKPYTTGLGGMAVTCDAAIGKRLRAVHRETVVPPAAARVRLLAQYAVYRRLFSPRRAWSAQAMLRTVSRLGLFVGSSSDAELDGELPTDHGWRMGRFQEAQGERLLRTVADRNAHADALADRYDGHFARSGWAPVHRTPGASLLRYPVAVANKKALLVAARAARVELGSWFETPLHPVPLEKHVGFGYVVGCCPNAERAARQVVNLPLHRRVSAAEADRIARFVMAHAERPAE